MSCTKRAWKLQEFVAHGANVNCLALGHKSGRVLVTGGDDKKVNLWAVGKPNCIMSLSGHTTPVECVRFGHTEELVCAGSASGALKIWDLEAAKLVRTLTGHKANIRCIDFHPYGEFMSSGSLDTNLKLWDIRRKGCIFTYKGHSETINNLKFSPDGQWIATAGEDAAVKIWDLRAGKLLAELKEHVGPVYDVEFHPHEFLLASASQDRTVNFWDLESLRSIGTTEGECGAVRCIYFHPDGECLFSGSQDQLKVYGWEPIRMYDSLQMGWGKVRDISTASNQLISASFQLSTVSLFVVDLKRVVPFGAVPGNNSSSNLNFRAGHHIRKSFVKEKCNSEGQKAQTQMKINEESDKSGTDPDDSDYSAADITDVSKIFRPRNRALTRTPPVEDDPFPAPFEAEDVSLPSFKQQEVCNGSPRSTRNNQRVEQVSPAVGRRSSVNIPSSNYGRVGPDDRAGKDFSNGSRRTSGPARPLSVHDSPVLDHQRQPFGKFANNRDGRDFPTSPTRTYPGSPPRHPDPRPQYERYDGDDYARDAPVSQPARRSPADPVVQQKVPERPGSLYPPQRQFGPTTDRPLDRPAVVRPSRSSQPEISVTYLNRGDPAGRQRHVAKPEATTPEKEKGEFVPMILDGPTGLDVDEFLPKKFQSARIGDPPYGGPSYGGLGGYQSELSESEVTSAILKGHDPMMTVLATRSRNLEIVRKLWTSKDAKAAVEQAVAVDDRAVVVDLLSVITLRPSIWNLDLCVILLNPISDLLQSKYEMYMNVGCSALKLILKNFATVIKTNIDQPVTTVGVDISREERFNKCMQCYKDLVKVRSFVLKKQTMQGKMGQTYRELSILMQYLD